MLLGSLEDPIHIVRTSSARDLGVTCVVVVIL